MKSTCSPIASHTKIEFKMETPQLLTVIAVVLTAILGISSAIAQPSSAYYQCGIDTQLSCSSVPCSTSPPDQIVRIKLIQLRVSLEFVIGTKQNPSQSPSSLHLSLLCWNESRTGNAREDSLGDWRRIFEELFTADASDDLGEMITDAIKGCSSNVDAEATACSKKDLYEYVTTFIRRRRASSSNCNLDPSTYCRQSEPMDLSDNAVKIKVIERVPLYSSQINNDTDFDYPDPYKGGSTNYNKKLALGLGIGLGLFVILLLIITIVLFAIMFNRRRAAAKKEAAKKASGPPNGSRAAPNNGSSGRNGSPVGATGAVIMRRPRDSSSSSTNIIRAPQPTVDLDSDHISFPGDHPGDSNIDSWTNSYGDGQVSVSPASAQNSVGIHQGGTSIPRPSLKRDDDSGTISTDVYSGDGSERQPSRIYGGSVAQTSTYGDGASHENQIYKSESNHQPSQVYGGSIAQTSTHSGASGGNEQFNKIYNSESDHQPSRIYGGSIAQSSTYGGVQQSNKIYKTEFENQPTGIYNGSIAQSSTHSGDAHSNKDIGKIYSGGSEASNRFYYGQPTERSVYSRNDSRDSEGSRPGVDETEMKPMYSQAIPVHLRSPSDDTIQKRDEVRSSMYLNEEFSYVNVDEIRLDKM